MSPRLAKEVRPLWLPLVLSAAALAAYAAIMRLAPPVGFYSSPLPTWIWVIGCTVLAAQAFGGEFQDRTMLLLLCQPTPRSRLWWEKYSVLLPAIAGLSAIFVLAMMLVDKPHLFSPWHLPAQFTLGGAAVVAALLTAPFWTFLTRSTTGAIVLMLAASFVAFAVGSLPVEAYYLRKVAVLQAYRGAVPPDPSMELGVIGGLFAAYGLGLFALGKRRFTRLQAVDSSTHAVSEAPMAAPALLGRMLRSAPDGAWPNLLRKELQLQRVCLGAAVLFLAMVLVAGVADMNTAKDTPSQRSAMEVVRLLPFAIFAPLIAILAGCLPFTEEKSLGVQGWQFTLPMGLRRQFAAKLAVALAVFALAGLALPWAALSAYAGFVPDSFPTLQANAGWIVVVLAGLLLSGIWISTASPNIVRALLGTLGLCGGALLLLSWASSLGGRTPLAVIEYNPLWLALTTGSTDPFAYFESLRRPGELVNSVPVLTGAIFALTLVFMAWRNFGQPMMRPKAFLRQTLGCTALLVVLGFLVGAAGNLPRRLMDREFSMYSRTIQSFADAFAVLQPRPGTGAAPAELSFTLDELRATGRLDSHALAAVSGEHRFTVRNPGLITSRRRTLDVTVTPALTIPGVRFEHIRIFSRFQVDIPR